jgi:hypothetical protein
MSYFTPNDYQPSEFTLHILRTIARSFPSKNIPEDARALHFS